MRIIENIEILNGIIILLQILNILLFYILTVPYLLENQKRAVLLKHTPGQHFTFYINWIQIIRAFLSPTAESIILNYYGSKLDFKLQTWTKIMKFI